ncbi:MAG TPA: signal peptidase II [Solirubrobacteraceae bacterium]|nr:signal peptidase II [Solirubrobacteraceae bacterium]
MTAPQTAATTWLRTGIVLVLVLAADQISKALVTGALERGETRELVAGVKLVNTRNSGVAFGQLQGGGVIVAILIAVAVVALLAYVARNAQRRWVWLPAGMLLGGALGNVADRIREGAVVDFVKLPHWPAFNVADSAITLGVIALLVVMERGDGARGRS